MIDRLEVQWRRLRRKLNRSEWAIRLLRLSKSAESPSARGLVMIQIDGLSQRQFLLALQQGHLPFIRRLIKNERYRLHSFYSGLPSSTPAVQGEIFYGVKTAVPSFNFIDTETGKNIVMLDSRFIEEQLQKHSEGLLKGGSAYANIYAAGAEENRYCGSNFGIGDMFKQASVWSPLVLAITNFYSLVRTSVLLVAELGLAIVDFFRGLISGEDLIKELKFVPTRVGICILLREMVTIAAKIDTARGLPIVHMNFLGYDEQAHRRGPSSAFAHWALKGIDDSIKRIWRAARDSARRDYDVWIYADHGQEDVVPYPLENGRTIQEAVADALEGMTQPRGLKSHEAKGIQTQRAQLLGIRMIKRYFGDSSGEVDPNYGKRVVVTAMGPIGHVYLPKPAPVEERDRLARALIEKANVPSVFAKDGIGQIRAWTKEGQFILPDQAEKIFGESHPYLKEAAEDLVDLVHHPNAGDFTIAGYRPGAKPISFPVENGSHAGFGPQETNAFALLPADAPLGRNDKNYLRPIDLRHAVMRFLKRPLPEAETGGAIHVPGRDGRVRIMTYNVHSCMGMDGKLSPERIARIIAQNDIDVVALQELDVGRMRTESIDQAEMIAEILEMKFHFHPALRLEEEQYGDAILSRLPIRLVRAGGLPGLNGRTDLEPRGALWVTLDIGGYEIQLLNTHLGLRPSERIVQTEALLGPEWLGHPDCKGSIVLCGDFNALPNSPVCRRIGNHLRDSQLGLDGHQPLNTWFGRAPFGRIDHIFASPNLRIVSVEVPNTELTRVASDHLPLIVEIDLS